MGDEDEQASAWVRATAPNGEGAYVGKVAWSPELGFGLRPPESADDEPATGVGGDAVKGRSSRSRKRQRDQDRDLPAPGARGIPEGNEEAG